MGRFIVIFVGVILVVLIGALGYIWVQGESLITQGVSSQGPRITGTPVRLSGVSFQPLGGKAGLKGFVLGTPEGFSADKSISVDEVSIDVAPRSLLSDTVHIRDIAVRAPEIVVEPTKRGMTNLQVIQKNIEKFTGPSDASASSGSTKNMIVDRLHIAAPKLRFSGGEIGLSDQSLELADITLTNIGVDQNGVPPGELVRLVSEAIMPQVTKAMATDRAQRLFDDLTQGRLNIDLSSNIRKQVEGQAREKVQQQVESAKEKAEDKVKEAVGEEAASALKGLSDRLGGKKDSKKDDNKSDEDDSDSP